MSEQISDARATIESIITGAFAETANSTGLRSGRGTDELRDAIIARLFEPPIHWAVAEYLKESEAEDQWGLMNERSLPSGRTSGDEQQCVIKRTGCYEFGPTKRSCPGMTKALRQEGCSVTIFEDEDLPPPPGADRYWLLDGCHGQIDEPFTFCPWCGRKLVLQE